MKGTAVHENDEAVVSLENILGAVIRRRWWIITATCVVALLTIGIVMILPDRYSSQAVIVIVPQQVSQRFVEPSSYTSAWDVLQTMTKEILSRSQLVKIIDSQGLYTDERHKLSDEQLADLMRKDIQIEALDTFGRTELRTFSISFSARTPDEAQAVTNLLASLFIEENLRARGDQAERTSSFISAQLEQTRRQLEESEKRKNDLKGYSVNRLPEQQQSNLSSLTDLRIDLQRTTGSLNNVKQTRTSLESTINEKIALLGGEKSLLLTRYTPKHTEVIKKDQEIEKMQALLARLKNGPSGRVEASTLPDSPVVIQLRSQIDSTAAEMETLSKDEARIRASIAQSQSRLSRNPLMEQQQAAIDRDIESYQKDYKDLKEKQLQSERTTRLENGQDAQRFRLIDSASYPHRPSGPKRLKISAGGLAVGLLVGLALAFLVESRNRSFRDEKEIRHSFSFPIVLGVPLLMTPQEERSRRRMVVVQWLLGSVMAIAVVAAELFVYQHG